MIRQLSQIALISALTLTLANCATSKNPKHASSKNSAKKSTVPKVPPRVIPGGSGDNWRYLGLSADRQITNEINESSIQPNGNGYQFQDRKTIVNPNQFNYARLTPTYKYSLSWWLLSCNSKRYALTAMSIYDNYGALIKNYSFSPTPDSWSNIPDGSLAAQQYDYICNGDNRQLGY